MQNIKLTVAYDGGAYLGWQKTPMGPSIEETLQTVLEQILQHPTPLQAASRTDAGVHALGQVVNFLSSKESIDLHRLQISLNSLLPKDIAVLDIEKVPPAFHPTLDCSGKEYHYNVCFGTAQLPHHRFYSWHYPYSLNLSSMQEAASFLIGTHDFSTFCNVKKNEKYDNHVREVKRLDITQTEEKRLRFQIEGNHFLYKMVRNLVGTLVYVGRGKLPIHSISSLLNSHDRKEAGVTAPAHGLFLFRVFY
jgi:tRNA pseudouridine38-40 synthase